MILEQLLGDAPRETFLQQHFLRLPFSRPGGADRFRALGTWETIDAVLASADPDVLVVRRGERWEEGDRVPTPAEARRLHEAGYTLLVRHAERHVPGIAELACCFAHDFRAPVDIHLYCTPASTHGFGWHYDAEDVFILQTEGRKEYSLRKNTVNPWPLAETLPADMRYEREVMPLMQCLLAPGDWLYVPHGWWHVAQAREASISLAIGLMMPGGIDLLDFLRPRLLESLLWRQRLPALDDAAAYSDLLAQLADDLSQALRDPALLESYLAARRP